MQERELRPYERVPDELKGYNQWVELEMGGKQGKSRSNPFTFGNAGVNWDSTWAPFDVAQTAAADLNFGLGFVLTEEDNYTVVDLDDCVGEDGSISARDEVYPGSSFRLGGAVALRDRIAYLGEK